MTRSASVGWLLLVLLASASVSASEELPLPWRQIYALGDPDLDVRFAAAQAIVASGLSAERFAAALEKEPFPEIRATSEVARAASDYVLRKLRGQSVEAEGALPESSPSVLMISIDTLRADHLGCYGYGRETSPAIDALAASGARFQAVSTTSWTLPSHMSMFTSMYPSFHKVEGGRDAAKLAKSDETFASRLKEAGYATVGFVANPFVEARWGFARGFDVYRYYEAAIAGEQVDRAVSWLEWHRFHVDRKLEEPAFLLFLHVNDPHEPYAAPPPFRSQFFPEYAGEFARDGKHVGVRTDLPFDDPEDLRYVVARYDGEIRYVDAQLERLFQRLRALGFAATTLVLLTADHGEEFLDHGAMGHKETLYDEQLKVPLIVSFPGTIDAGQEPVHVASQVDIAPTILDFTNQSSLSSAQGHSLRAHLEGGSGASERLIYSELGPIGVEWERPFHRKAVRSAHGKLIVNQFPDGSKKKEYYVLGNDSAEQSNQYSPSADDPEQRRLEAELDKFVETGQTHRLGAREEDRIELDAETRERLRALGYDL